MTIDVRMGEVMIASKREVPAAVLEADISDPGEYLPVAKVGLGNEPNSSARVTGESREPNGN